MTAEYAWFDNGEGRQVYRRVRKPVETRSALPCPSLISDQIEVTSQVDGRIYDSKAALRRSYKAKGYVEVGNDWLNKDFHKPEPKVDRKAIRDSVGKALNRVGISV